MFENVRRVSSQLLAYGSADVAILVINFLLLPLYTRVLSPDEYGVLALLIACEAFLKVVFRWGLDVSLLRLHYDHQDEEERRTLAGTVMVILLVANGIVLAVLAGFAGPISRAIVGGSGYALAFALVAVNLFLSTFLFLPFVRLRVQQKAARFATLTFFRSLAVVIARLVLVVGFGLGVLGIVLADVIVSAGMLVVFIPLLREMIAFRYSNAAATQVLAFGLPRVPQGLMHQGMAISDRFFLGLYLPLADIGLYMIATSIASLTKLYSVSFNTAWMPFAYDSMERTDAPRLYARMGSYSFAVLMFVAIGVSTLAESLIALMTPAEYHASTTLVPLLAAGIVAQAAAAFMSTALNVAKKAAVLPVTTAISAAVTIAGHLLLIPRFGVMGAAAGVFAGQFALAASLGIFGHRAYPIPYEWDRLGKVALLSAVLYAAITSIDTGSHVLTLVFRALVLCTFPLGLIALRFFTPKEWSDMKRALHLIRPGGLERSSPPAI